MARVEVVGFVPFGETEDDADEIEANSVGLAGFEELLEQRDVDRVFLVPAGSDRDEVLETVTRATARGVKVSIVPRLLEVVGSAVEFDTVGGITLLGVRRLGLSRSSLAIKRVMDVAGALLALAASAPVAAVAALAIKLDSPGPVLFRQPRVGRDGRVFNMFKFRSMVADAQRHQARLEALNESVGTFKLADDPRITRVGRVLRRLSIDELPQLINVLRGDMSLVGPRPLVLAEDRLVSGRHRQRLQLAPGMTGPWQVLGPRRPPLSEMVKTDYLYVANWSLWSDVKILLRTFLHMATRRGR